MTIDLTFARTALDACPLTDRAREAVDGLIAEVERLRAEVARLNRHRQITDGEGDTWTACGDGGYHLARAEDGGSCTSLAEIEKHYGLRPATP